MSADDVVIAVCRAIRDTIAEFGDAGVPSGHLYAATMAFWDATSPSAPLERYEQVVSLLVRADLVERSGHLLRIKRRA